MCLLTSNHERNTDPAFQRRLSLHLRRYEMSGGYIKNAALRAAFLAADEDSDITFAHLAHAARVEYEGMGKIVAG